MMDRILFSAAILAGVGVVLGAFGAHGLKQVLSPELLEVWHTAVTYQMWHALGLGLIASLRMDSPTLQWSARLMISGILLFSGSLYLLALTGIQALGMITPFGGLAFVAAWGLLAWRAWGQLQTSR